MRNTPASSSARMVLSGSWRSRSVSGPLSRSNGISASARAISSSGEGSAASARGAGSFPTMDMPGCIVLFGQHPRDHRSVEFNALNQPEMKDALGLDVVHQRAETQLFAIGLGGKAGWAPVFDVLEIGR